MTLFRKVFPNQSRPATEEETLNEQALREAFTEMRETKEPFLLDPFKHAAADTLDFRTEEDIDPEGLEEALNGAPLGYEPDDLDAAGCPDAEDMWATESYEADGMAEEEAAATGSKSTDVPQPDTLSQSDADISAVLNRAMTAEPAPQEAGGAEAQADDHQSDMEKAEPAEEDSAQVADEAGQAFGGDATQPDPDSDELDAVTFARAQMAAMKETAMQENVAPAAEPEGAELDLSKATGIEAVPAPAPGRVGRRAGRAKTRLLGFNRPDDGSSDPFTGTQEATATAQREKFPVGWLVIVEGPGVGHSFSIFTGASMIGRGEDQVIRLDFGDNAISRNNHAAIAYDEEQNKFYIGHGGKSNIIRRNARPVLSTEELHHADLIRIGETTLRFVALCGSDFKWDSAEDKDV